MSRTWPCRARACTTPCFLATAHNSVYAFDADDLVAPPLWKVNLGPSVPAAEIYTTHWTDMRVEIGITSHSGH